MLKNETHAIIPARSGSKSLKNKNIIKFLGIPLFAHSILFAKKLSFIDKIIFSSDSKSYLKKAAKFSNIFLHHRSKKASQDNSMEEDIIKDLIKFYKANNILLPKNILWLRPTSPIRCLKTFESAYKIYKKNNLTVMITHKVDSRLFFSKKNFLYPLNKIFKKKSMVRRQDIKPFYKIFSGELFKLKKIINKNFLSSKKNYVVAPEITNFDIDNKQDLMYLKFLIQLDNKKFKKYIHNKIS